MDRTREDVARLVSNMGGLEVDRCWFEGFDDAIEVDANYGTQMKITQTMIVPNSRLGSDQTHPSEGYGWGLKFKFVADIRPMPKGARPKPNLILDHCLVEGAGLFDLTSSPRSGATSRGCKSVYIPNKLLAGAQSKTAQDRRSNPLGG